MTTVNQKRQVWTISLVGQCDPIIGTLSPVLSTLVDGITFWVESFQSCFVQEYLYAKNEAVLLDKRETAGLLLNEFLVN